MTEIRGKKIVGGKARGPALVTSMPINFTAAFSKPKNLLPGGRSTIQDKHHELDGCNIKGKVLIFPAAIGSTYTGMMLLQLMYGGIAPAALVAGNADSLLASGSILAGVWFGKGVPIVEYGGEDLFGAVRSGDPVEVDGDAGLIILP